MVNLLPDRPKRRWTDHWWWTVGALVAVTLLLSVAAFFALGSVVNHLIRGDFMQRSISPDGHWTVRVYEHNPAGAAGPEWLTADLLDNRRQLGTRKIFELNDFNHIADSQWTPDGNHLRIRWKSASVVSIGGHDITLPDGHWSD